MSTLRTLKQSARESATWRGHVLTNFKQYSHGTYLAHCKVCTAWVQVLINPAPNQIDIGGPAVALTCPVKGGGND